MTNLLALFVILLMVGCGQDILHEAAEAGNLELIEKEIAEGANINSQNGRDGETPLQRAATRGQIEAAELLLSKGADVNIGRKKDGQTALDLAEDRGHEDLAKLLKKNGGRSTSYRSGSPVDLLKGIKWKYDDSGRDLGTAWREVSFDDAAWEVGYAPLGYGDEDIGTVIEFGPNEKKKHITSYFRVEFEVSKDYLEMDALVSLRCDDGAIIYLNGIEVIRYNMPAGEVSYMELSEKMISGPEENIFTNYPIDSKGIQKGRNVLAAQVHQRAGISSDLIFDLRFMPIGSKSNQSSVETPQVKSIKELLNGIDALLNDIGQETKEELVDGEEKTENLPSYTPVVEPEAMVGDVAKAFAAKNYSAFRRFTCLGMKKDDFKEFMVKNDNRKVVRAWDPVADDFQKELEGEMRRAFVEILEESLKKGFDWSQAKVVECERDDDVKALLRSGKVELSLHLDDCFLTPKGFLTFDAPRAKIREEVQD